LIVVLDTSVIVAILLQEPGYERLAIAIDGATEIVVGAPAVLEAGMVLSSRLRQDARSLIHALLRQIRARVVPFDDAQAWAATGAFLRFGRGRHPAALNFGDCMSYAVASVAGLPLLYTGDDFGKTDIDGA
jgi:ribonuclease VapC